MLLPLLLLAFQKPIPAVPGGDVSVLVGEVGTDSAIILVRQGRAEFRDLRLTISLAGEELVAVRQWEIPDGARGQLKPLACMALSGLKPDTEYVWTLQPRWTKAIPMGGRGRFRTLAGEEIRRSVRFVVANGMNHHYFHHGGQGRPAYAGEDKNQGYPALEAIDRLAPDFLAFTGDSVYYDRPAQEPATEADAMRAHWQRLFRQPRMESLLATTPTYWIKDDHDHRYNDSDRTGDKAPSHELGRRVFREQVPIVAPGDDQSPTWRTHRVSKDLQIWLVEGRDHRSPNAMPDGPDKTLWGIEQRDWLKRTLLESDAAFKILISPTPLVGPDDAYKSDNHTNPKGFRHEGEAFHAWLAEHELNERGFFVICGDRHWQYHSIHPRGTHEFSVGAMVDANARLGRAPGDPKSTDPDQEIRQPYTSAQASGGFLEVRLVTEPELRVELIFRDERGIELHRTVRRSYP